MVPLVLARVAAGELPHRPRERVALPHVGVDGHRVAGAGVRAGQRVAACGGELGEDGRDEVGRRDDLHVAVLAHVVVAAGQRTPADEDVRRALHHPLAGDDASAMVVVLAGVRARLVDGRPGLLALQEERVGTRTTREEHQVHDHADTAHPHDLADHVHGGEAVEQGAAILLEREPVPGQQVVHDVLLLAVVDGDAERGLGGDARPSACHRGQLGERPAAGPPLLAPLDPHLHLAPVGRLEGVDEVLCLHAVVPDVDLGHGGVAAHPSPVGVDGRRDRSVRLGGLDRVLPGRHHQAGRQARHVPLERAGKCLVEVTQVEVELALGRRPQPVVQDVGIAAELDLDPAVRPRRQVRRHDRGGAPVVVPRGQRHALVPERDQVGEADGVLGRDGLEGVVPPRPLVPVADALPRRQDPGLAPALPALGRRGREVVPRGDGCGCHEGLVHGARPPWVG